MLMGGIKQRFTQATADFERYVKDLAEQALKQKIYSVEIFTDKDVTDFLDKLAGIDAWGKTANDVRGIALRVQRCRGKNWRTFTIRYRLASGRDTEYAKRKKAIESGAVYPYYTIQAYIDDDRLLGFGITKTSALIKAVDDMVAAGVRPIKTSGKYRDDMAEFYAIPYNRLPRDLLIEYVADEEYKEGAYEY